MSVNNINNIINMSRNVIDYVDGTEHLTFEEESQKVDECVQMYNLYIQDGLEKFLFNTKARFRTASDSMYTKSTLKILHKEGIELRTRRILMYILNYDERGFECSVSKYARNPSSKQYDCRVADAWDRLEHVLDNIFNMALEIRFLTQLISVMNIFITEVYDPTQHAYLATKTTKENEEIMENVVFYGAQMDLYAYCKSSSDIYFQKRAIVYNLIKQSTGRNMTITKRYFKHYITDETEAYLTLERYRKILFI